jgi:hypothetical protein
VLFREHGETRAGRRRDFLPSSGDAERYGCAGRALAWGVCRFGENEGQGDAEKRGERGCSDVTETDLFFIGRHGEVGKKLRRTRVVCKGVLSVEVR